MTPWREEDCDIQQSRQDYILRLCPLSFFPRASEPLPVPTVPKPMQYSLMSPEKTQPNTALPLPVPWPQLCPWGCLCSKRQGIRVLVTFYFVDNC